MLWFTISTLCLCLIDVPPRKLSDKTPIFQSIERVVMIEDEIYESIEKELNPPLDRVDVIAKEEPTVEKDEDNVIEDDVETVATVADDVDDLSDSDADDADKSSSSTSTDEG